MNSKLNTLVLAAFIALATAGTASAAGAQSGQIIIKGTVGAICEVSVVDYGTNLDLVAGETDRAVGEVTETCNDPDGYSITLSSTNQSRMVGPRGAASAYTVNYDTLQFGSLSSDQQLDHADPRWNANFGLRVNVDGQSELPAGNYSDTVTITIAAA